MFKASQRHLATLVAAGLMASAAGLGLYLDASQSQSLHEHQAEQKAQEYHDAASKRALARCSLVPRAGIRECVHEQYDAAAKGEHDEYDLQAQLVTSVWTRAMGIAALIAMAVGIFGVGLIYTTFRETRRAADAAHDANRPWIELKVQPAEFITDGETAKLDVGVLLNNRGKSPATSVVPMTVLIPIAPGDDSFKSDIAIKALQKIFASWDANGHLGGLAVFPGDRPHHPYRATTTYAEIAATMGDASEDVRLLLGVGVWYSFGDRTGVTINTYRVSGPHIDLSSKTTNMHGVPTLEESFAAFAA